MGKLLGYIFIRVMLFAAAVTILWTAWYGQYWVAAALLLTLGYFFYLTWRPIDVNEDLIDSKYWNK